MKYDEIIKEIPIAKVISSFLKLEKVVLDKPIRYNGVVFKEGYKAISPFSDPPPGITHTLFISPEHKMWVDFSRNQFNGDVIDFVARFKDITKRKAREWIITNKFYILKRELL